MRKHSKKGKKHKGHLKSVKAPRTHEEHSTYTDNNRPISRKSAIACPCKGCTTKKG